MYDESDENLNEKDNVDDVDCDDDRSLMVITVLMRIFLPTKKAMTILKIFTWNFVQRETDVPPGPFEPEILAKTQGVEMVWTASYLYTAENYIDEFLYQTTSLFIFPYRT